MPDRLVTEPAQKEQVRPDDRINLSFSGLVRLAWQGRLRLAGITALCALVGVGVALLTPAEFVSNARIMPEMNSATGGMFKQLASVARISGLDLSDAEGVDAVRPDLYPNVLQSTPFVLFLLDQVVAQTGGKQTTVAKVLTENNGLLVRWFASDREEVLKRIRTQAGKPVELTQQQEELVAEIGKRVDARLDTRSGVITITAKMPDAHVAAAVAQRAMDYLTQYVTSYRTEKARQDLRFYAQRLSEAQKRYQTAQYQVFHYNDAHKNFVVQAATMEKQRREAELTIAQTVYTELSRQFEQAKLKVQERTPVFKVLEPATVPTLRVSPKRTLMVLAYAVAGFFLGMAYLLAQRSNWAGRLQAIIQN